MGCQSDSPTRCFPVEWRPRGVPRVLHVVEPLAGNAARGQVVYERSGHRYDGVEPPQRVALQPLVEAIPPVTTRETVDCRDHGNASGTCHSCIEYVSPIAVSVNHVRTQPVTRARNLRPLLQIAPPRYFDGEYLDPSVPERRQKRVVELATGTHGTSAVLHCRAPGARGQPRPA